MTILIEYIINDLVSLKKDNRTRGHVVASVKNQYRLNIRKYLLSQSVIQSILILH